MDDLFKTGVIASSGMKAQATRLRIVSENIANANSLSSEAGGQPYRRKEVSFKNLLDKQVGADLVKVNRITTDKGELERTYDPSHPGADGSGYVLQPNVNPLIEMMDMREAQRSYEANLNVISVSKDMLSKTINMLR
ncbi:MAG: flagellar basal body rod protein FlgC [Alphaproteobacteria bacterium RIFOXYD12_FULL_60_8]|nr:MAG: flagellar basal body rod protein FlgC [Alphaproteobacteria bacterium RIFOXYD12_FULL_60_8]